MPQKTWTHTSHIHNRCVLRFCACHPPNVPTSHLIIYLKKRHFVQKSTRETIAQTYWFYTQHNARVVCAEYFFTCKNGHRVKKCTFLDRKLQDTSKQIDPLYRFHYPLNRDTQICILLCKACLYQDWSYTVCVVLCSPEIRRYQVKIAWMCLCHNKGPSNEIDLIFEQTFTKVALTWAPEGTEGKLNQEKNALIIFVGHL